MKAVRNQNVYRVRGEQHELVQVHRDFPKMLDGLYREAEKQGIDMTSLRISVELSTREPSEVPG